MESEQAGLSLSEVLALLQHSMYSNFEAVVCQIGSFFSDQRVADKDKFALVALLSQSNVGLFIISRCLQATATIAPEVINYRLSLDCFTPEQRETFQLTEGQSVITGFIKEGAVLGYTTLAYHRNWMPALDKETMCDGEFPLLARLCSSHNGVNLLRDFPSMHKVVTREVFNKPYKIAGIDEPLTPAQMLSYSTLGCGLLLHSDALFSLLDPKMCDRSMSSGYDDSLAIRLYNYMVAPSAFRESRYVYLSRYLEMISSERLNKTFDEDSASILQLLVDSDDYMSYLDNEVIINKITSEGLNTYCDGRNVIGALASFPDGMELICKYPRLLELATERGLSATMDFGFDTDGQSALVLLQSSSEGLAALRRSNNPYLRSMFPSLSMFTTQPPHNAQYVTPGLPID